MRTTISLGGIVNAVVVDNRADRSVRARIRDNAPHSHYALERDDIAIELEAFRQVCLRVGRHRSWTVWESFGGSGWHTALIQKFVEPMRHAACDISSDCCSSICATCPSVRAMQIDFNDDPGSPCDWHHADFNLWTMQRLHDDQNFRASFARMFALAKELVTFTDTTPYEFQKHNAGVGPYSYWVEKVLKPSLGAFFGWDLAATYCWGPAAMHVLSRGTSAPYSFTEVKEPMRLETIDTTS